MSTDDVFHERVSIAIRLGRTAPPGELNQQMKGLGFTLDYDVYSMPRPESAPYANWESRQLAVVYLYKDGNEVDAQDECDTVELRYPLATINSAHVEPFLRTLEATHARLGGSLLLSNAPTTVEAVSQHITQCITDLLENWGEEPGSKSLRRMIMESHGR